MLNTVLAWLKVKVMAAKQADRIRNIGIMAHIDAGKTTVSERILFYSGRTHKISEVHDGQATMDFMDQERERGITISSAVNEISWNDHDIYLIDTPGHVDFTLEVERSLRVLDGVIAVLDAVSGVEPQTETVWYQADRHKVARIGFINKMDRPGADLDRCVAEIEKILGAHPIVLQMPILSDQGLEGVIDLIEQRAIYFDPSDQGSSLRYGEIPEALRAEAQLRRDRMIENLANADDAVANLFLEELPITTDEIHAALRRAVISLKGVPILCGSGLRNVGIQPLMDAIVDYLPAPTQLPPVVGEDLRGKPVTRERSSKDPFSALVFKTQQLEGKKLMFLRIYSGSLNEGDTVANTTQNNSFKIKHIYKLYANRIDTVKSAPAGTLVAILKARPAITGDTLCDPSHPLVLERISAYLPVIAISIEPESSKDKDKLSDALAALTEEDPTLVFEEDTQTGELLLRGMGELHLEVACERLKREFNILVRKGKPSVVCKESVRGEGEGRAEFERESDTDLIYGEVRVSVKALKRGSASICEIALPEGHPYVKQDVLDAVLDGARGAMAYGPNGFEMVDVDVRISYIGSDSKACYHCLGSKIAAAEAVRAAFRNAGSVILEPLMYVDIIAAEDHIGDLISDLSQRGGIVSDLKTADLRSVIHAVVPLRHMFGYTMKLRSLTHGRGSFSMRFKSFDSLDNLDSGQRG
ncbi:MAG: elongation factor G [Bradymonadales bacterium]|jgi:elongation factor G